MDIHSPGLCKERYMLESFLHYKICNTFISKYLNNILTVFVSILHDRASYAHRAFLYVLQWRVKISAVQIGLRDQVGESGRRDEEGFFGNCAHAGAYHSQRDSREDVTVVTLARIEGPAVIRDRWER